MSRKVGKVLSKLHLKFSDSDKWSGDNVVETQNWPLFNNFTWKWFECISENNYCWNSQN